MTRRPGSRPACRTGIVAALAAVALAAAMLLPPAPAEAGWLGRGLGVAGAARSIKRNFGEAVDLLDDTLGAAIQGDFEEVERLSGELREVPGRIITDAFPALGVGAATLEKAEAAGDWLNAARRRVGRFVSDAVADDRMALEAGKYEIEAGVLDPKRPLPAVTLSGPSATKRPAPAGKSAANAPDPWGQDPEEDEKAATGGPDPWGQGPKEEETTAGDVEPPGEDGQAGREGGDETIDRLQGEYAAALDRYLSVEEGSSDYEATLSALLEREKELLAAVAGPEEQELTPDERRRVQACLAEREFDPGAADGIFGPRTRTAIRAWQAARSREESGRLDQSSARTLLEECEVALAEAKTTEESQAVAKITPHKETAHERRTTSRATERETNQVRSGCEITYGSYTFPDSIEAFNEQFPGRIEVDDWGKFISPENCRRNPYTLGTFSRTETYLGSLYNGELCNGIPHGKGVLKKKGGSWHYGYYYEGEWRNGFPHGHGKMVMGTKDVYTFEGEFRNGFDWDGVASRTALGPGGKWYPQGSMRHTWTCN